MQVFVPYRKMFQYIKQRYKIVAEILPYLCEVTHVHNMLFQEYASLLSEHTVLKNINRPKLIHFI